MRQALSVIGFIIVAVVLFLAGLMPGERELQSSGGDSYILVGIARFAVNLTGFCEFVLGAALVAVWHAVRTRLSTLANNASS